MSLTDIELRALLLFANYGPLSGYDIHSKKKEDKSGKDADTNIMSDAYWVTVRKNLLDLQLITECPEEGRRKPFILGVDGFDYLVRTQLQKITHFDTFVEVYKMYFPLVFGYWDMLRDAGLVDYVMVNLGRNVEEIYLGLFEDFVRGRILRYSHQEFIEDLYARIYLPELFWSTGELDKVLVSRLFEFRRAEPVIFDFLKAYLVKRKKDLIEKLETIERVEKTLE
jgi:hypothetical protein